MGKLTVIVSPRVSPPSTSREGPIERWEEVQARAETYGGSFVNVDHVLKRNEETLHCPFCRYQLTAARHKRLKGEKLVATWGGNSKVMRCKNCEIRFTIPRRALRGLPRELQAA